jgi:hypothetical protein
MSEFNSDVLTDTLVRPLGGSPASPGDLDKLKNAAGAIGYPLLASEILGSGVFTVCQEMADVATGTSKVFRYYCSFPVILHGAHAKIAAGTTVAFDVLADTGSGFASVLDAPEAIGGTTTLHEVKPESDSYEFDRGDWLEVSIASSGGDSATGIYVDMVLQRR